MSRQYSSSASILDTNEIEKRLDSRNEWSSMISMFSPHPEANGDREANIGIDGEEPAHMRSLSSAGSLILKDISVPTVVRSTTDAPTIRQSIISTLDSELARKSNATKSSKDEDPEDPDEDRIKTEIAKRVASENLLMKLYEELSRLKLLTQTSREMEKLDDIKSEIEMMDRSKLERENDTKSEEKEFSKNMDILSDNIKLFLTCNDTEKVSAVGYTVNLLEKNQENTLKVLQSKTDQLVLKLALRNQELKKATKELEYVKDQILFTKTNHIDTLSELVRDTLESNKKIKKTKNWTNGIKNNLVRAAGSIRHNIPTISDPMQGVPDIVTASRPYHKFLPHTYRSPRKCDLCNETLWGKEFKCEVCSLHCHARCSHATGQCGSIKVSSDTTVFGVLLSNMGKDSDSNQVPMIVRLCIEAMELRGMDIEGIYRKSGPQSQVNSLISSFNSGSPKALGGPEIIDVTVISSTLKNFFRELPESLIEPRIYSDMLEVIQRPPSEERTTDIHNLLFSCQSENVATLSFLINHLFRVQLRAEKNLMTAQNLGVVFGPTIMKPFVQNAQSDIADCNHKSSVIEFLILNAQQIFPVVEFQ